MSEQLFERLRELDNRLARAAPAFHRKLEPPATQEQLAALVAEAGDLPADVLVWFGWHAGSGDGFIPGTSWGLATPEEAADAIRIARVDPQLAAQTFVPLLTGRDGSLVYYVVVASEPEIWEYDRGERVRTTSFRDWIAKLLAAWDVEAAVLRVAWMRWQRSPLGWHELHLPASARAKWRRLLEKPPFRVTDASYVDGTFPLLVSLGERSEWVPTSENRKQALIQLTEEGARALASTMAKEKQRETFVLPGIEDLRVAFVSR